MMNQSTLLNDFRENRKFQPGLTIPNPRETGWNKWVRVNFVLNFCSSGRSLKKNPWVLSLSKSVTVSLGNFKNRSDLFLKSKSVRGIFRRGQSPKKARYHMRTTRSSGPRLTEIVRTWKFCSPCARYCPRPMAPWEKLLGNSGMWTPFSDRPAIDSDWALKRSLPVD